MNEKAKERVFLTIAASGYEDYARFAVMSGRQLMQIAKEQRKKHGFSMSEMMNMAGSSDDPESPLIDTCDKFNLDPFDPDYRKLAACMVFLDSQEGFAMYPPTVEGIIKFQEDADECATFLKGNAINFAKYRETEGRVFLLVSHNENANSLTLAVRDGRQVAYMAKDIRKKEGRSYADLLHADNGCHLTVCSLLELDPTLESDRKIAVCIGYLASKNSHFAAYPVTVEGLTGFQADVSEFSTGLKRIAVTLSHAAEIVADAANAADIKAEHAAEAAYEAAAVAESSQSA
jgi:hypothetical protein